MHFLPAETFPSFQDLGSSQMKQAVSDDKLFNPTPSTCTTRLIPTKCRSSNFVLIGKTGGEHASIIGAEDYRMFCIIQISCIIKQSVILEIFWSLSVAKKEICHLRIIYFTGLFRRPNQNGEHLVRKLMQSQRWKSDKFQPAKMWIDIEAKIVIQPNI